MSSTHIVYVITKLELGGAQKVCLKLYQEVPCKKEYTTALIAGAGGILDQYVQSLPTVQLLPDIHREVSLRGIWNEVKAFMQLVRSLRKIRIQHPQVIVHTHSTKAGLLGRWAALFAGIKHRIHTIHGYAFHEHQPRLLWFTIYILELITSLITTQFICVSTYDSKLGKKLFPRFAHKYTLIRAAVDWDRFHGIYQATLPSTNTKAPSLRNADAPFILGTVACFKPQKNLIDLLRVVHRLSQQTNIRCEIIGDGTLRPILEQWIAQHNITAHVHLHGWTDNVAPLMATWDLFALTSLWEGLPCSIVEARILKLPVFAYNTGGISDIITSGQNGMLYQQGAWRELADGIYRCTYDTAWYTTLAQYPDTLDAFRDQEMVAQHQKLYHRLHQQSSF